MGPGGLGLGRQGPRSQLSGGCTALEPARLVRLQVVRNHLDTGLVGVQVAHLLPTPPPCSVVGSTGSRSVKRGPGPERCPLFPWKSHFSEAAQTSSCLSSPAAPPQQGGRQHPGTMSLPSPQQAGSQQGTWKDGRCRPSRAQNPPSDSLSPGRHCPRDYFQVEGRALAQLGAFLAGCSSLASQNTSQQSKGTLASEHASGIFYPHVFGSGLANRLCLWAPLVDPPQPHGAPCRRGI